MKQRLEEMQKRLEMLNVIDNKINTIINILSDKRNIEPMTTFTPASNKASDKFIIDRQKELFNS